MRNQSSQFFVDTHEDSVRMWDIPAILVVAKVRFADMAYVDATLVRVSGSVVREVTARGEVVRELGTVADMSARGFSVVGRMARAVKSHILKTGSFEGLNLHQVYFPKLPWA